MDELETILGLPVTENYTEQDRYNDFRHVFFGSDQGKRVFRELIGWGKLFRPSVHSSPVDPYLTHVREGEANFARKLLYVASNEPKGAPVKAQSKRTDK